ncbi:MAG: sulfotransferase [Cyanobacteriota bacterium]|nr:sulfotransferase [Cyanobacteriota bacterium]
MTERLPDFLGLGTQKGGTTSLHQLLSAHPQVHLPAAKELHYFDLQPDLPTAWYSQQFKSSTAEQLCGEITPFYLFHPDVPKRIKALLPRVKLLVLLRDPVERALSQIFHARQRGFEALEPAEAIAAEGDRLASGDPISLQKHSYLARSRYLEQLDRYEALFPKSQILVMQSEALFRQPEPIWQQLQRFLNLDAIPMPPLPVANAGGGAGRTVDPALRAQLRDALATTASGVRERYGFGWDWA